jgi:hypothetical protein
VTLTKPFHADPHDLHLTNFPLDGKKMEILARGWSQLQQAPKEDLRRLLNVLRSDQFSSSLVRRHPKLHLSSPLSFGPEKFFH